jgi:electron transport complex protein RnfC
MERVVTVTGRAIGRPSNVKVRIGTKIGEIIEDCGGFREPPGKIILGGPLTGFSVADLDTPVTKAVSGIIALTRRETGRFANNPCIRCSRCLKACPWGLFPTVLFKLIEYNEIEAALQKGLLDCRECGCCAYVCPARIPLVQSFKYGKLMKKIGKTD